MTVSFEDGQGLKEKGRSDRRIFLGPESRREQTKYLGKDGG